LLLDDLSFDDGAQDVHASVVEVLDAGAQRPDEVLDGEGDLEPPEAMQGPGAEALDRLATELGPAGTVGLSIDLTSEDQDEHYFFVWSMLPLSDEARELLVSTLSGEISLTSWASYAE
jgi:hypothetical protein